MALAAMGAMADATLLLLLFAASHAAEERLYARATGDLTDVSARLPPTALVQRQPPPAQPVVTPLSDVRRGDRIVIKAGEVVRASSLDCRLSLAPRLGHEKCYEGGWPRPSIEVLPMGT